MRRDDFPLQDATSRAESLSRDSNLQRLEETLRVSAVPATMDPAFRSSLRASLVTLPSPTLYSPLETPLGQIWVAYRDDILRYLSSVDEATFLARARETLGEPMFREEKPPATVARRVVAAIEGRRPLPEQVDLSTVTPFQRAVLEAALRIPRGEVRSYAWIARELGHPRAVRAVGTALARNPIQYVIPCHRVVRADGDLGNYSGGGVETKERALRYEGVDLPHLHDLAQRGLRFRGSRNTKIFCLPTCYSNKHASEKHTIFFHTQEEAFQAGFRPCKLCRPVAMVSA